MGFKMALIIEGMEEKRMNHDEISLLKSLRDSNAGKDKIICGLIKDLIKKDNQILKLKEGHEFIEKWLRWNQKKQIGDHR